MESTSKASMATDDIIADIDPPEIDEREATVRRFDDTVYAITVLQSILVEYSDQGNPELLSKCLVRLAEKNAVLGILSAKLNYLARVSLQVCDIERSNLKLAHIDDKMSVARSETLARIETQDLFDAASEVQQMADEANNLGRRVDSLLKMGQSRLSLIKNDVEYGK